MPRRTAADSPPTTPAMVEPDFLLATGLSDCALPFVPSKGEPFGFPVDALGGAVDLELDGTTGGRTIPVIDSVGSLPGLEATGVSMSGFDDAGLGGGCDCGEFFGCGAIDIEGMIVEEGGGAGFCCDGALEGSSAAVGDGAGDGAVLAGVFAGVEATGFTTMGDDVLAGVGEAVGDLAGAEDVAAGVDVAAGALVDESPLSSDTMNDIADGWIHTRLDGLLLERNNGQQT